VRVVLLELAYEYTPRFEHDTPAGVMDLFSLAHLGRALAIYCALLVDMMDISSSNTCIHIYHTSR